MSDVTDATSESAVNLMTDALGAVGTTLEQFALALRELAVAVWHGAATTGQVLIQRPITLNRHCDRPYLCRSGMAREGVQPISSKSRRLRVPATKYT